MKSAVESLSPTRVRLTVEVAFEELKPDLAVAYREIGRQVRVSGFRPGKVPARILDQRVGRGVVLEQAVQEAVPRLYGDALRANDVQVVGQPAVEVTKFTDGDELIFTAEVDVRPEIVLPDYAGLPVTVDDADVTDEEIDEQIAGLRDRFGTLTTVDRPVSDGDFVLLDTVATVDGEEVPGGGATGLSYEVGSASLMPGLDEAVLGASEGDHRTFSSDLVRGEYAGRTAAIDVTVRSVKVKDLPELDDDFAQTASEFDTLAEMREDIRSRAARVKRVEQGISARDRVLEALLERVDVPIPDGMLQAEVDWRRTNIDEQLAEAGISKEDYFAAEDTTSEELDAEITTSAQSAVKAQFVLEAVASKEEVGVSEAELTDHIVRRAQQAGMSPDAFARQVVEAGALGTLATEIVRGKALAIILEHAVITDASGRAVDLNAVSEDFEAMTGGTTAGAPVDELDDDKLDDDELDDDELGDDELDDDEPDDGEADAVSADDAEPQLEAAPLAAASPLAPSVQPAE